MTCHKPLTLVIEPLEEEDETMEGTEQEVDDDVLLRCGCHFHWSDITRCKLRAFTHNFGPQAMPTR